MLFVNSRNGLTKQEKSTVFNMQISIAFFTSC